MKTHCVRGHAFDEANTRVTGRQRVCRACQREDSAARYARDYRSLRRSTTLEGFRLHLADCVESAEGEP